MNQANAMLANVGAQNLCPQDRRSIAKAAHWELQYRNAGRGEFFDSFSTGAKRGNVNLEALGIEITSQFRKISLVSAYTELVDGQEDRLWFAQSIIVS